MLLVVAPTYRSSRYPIPPPPTDRLRTSSSFIMMLSSLISASRARCICTGKRFLANSSSTPLVVPIELVRWAVLPVPSKDRLDQQCLIHYISSLLSTATPYDPTGTSGRNILRLQWSMWFPSHWIMIRPYHLQFFGYLSFWNPITTNQSLLSKVIGNGLWRNGVGRLAGRDKKGIMSELHGSICKIVNVVQTYSRCHTCFWCVDAK